jgi:hypothetical protein
MEPWPPVLVFFWRFVIFPLFIVLTVGLGIAGINVVISPWRVAPTFGILVVAVIIVNLLVYRLEAHTCRVDALEKKIDALLQKPPETENT